MESHQPGQCKTPPGSQKFSHSGIRKTVTQMKGGLRYLHPPTHKIPSTSRETLHYQSWNVHTKIQDDSALGSMSRCNKEWKDSKPLSFHSRHSSIPNFYVSSNTRKIKGIVFTWNKRPWEYKKIFKSVLATLITLFLDTASSTHNKWRSKLTATKYCRNKTWKEIYPLSSTFWECFDVALELPKVRCPNLLEPRAQAEYLGGLQIIELSAHSKKHIKDF